MLSVTSLVTRNLRWPFLSRLTKRPMVPCLIATGVRAPATMMSSVTAQSRSAKRGSRLASTLNTAVSNHDSEAWDETVNRHYDANQWYPVAVGDVLASRYEVRFKLGWTAEATIWLCKDLEKDAYQMLCVRVSGAPAATEADVSNHITLEAMTRGEDQHPGMAHLPLVQHSFYLESPSGAYHECLAFNPTVHMLSEMPDPVVTTPTMMCLSQNCPQLFRGNGISASERLPVLLGFLLRGLELLHRVGVVHTGLRAGTLLFSTDHVYDGTMGSNEYFDHLLEDAYTKHPNGGRTVLPDRIHHGLLVDLGLDHITGVPIMGDFRRARIGKPGQKFQGRESIESINSSFDSHLFKVQKEEDGPWVKSKGEGTGSWEAADAKVGIDVSRLYDPPEKVMGHHWGPAADMWQFGLLVWDILQDDKLFRGERKEPNHYDDYTHVLEIIELLGPPPTKYMEEVLVPKIKHGADDRSTVDMLMKDIKKGLPTRTLEDRLTSVSGKDKEMLLDLIGKVVRWIPQERAMATELLEHEFLAGWNSEEKLARFFARPDFQ